MATKSFDRSEPTTIRKVSREVRINTGFGGVSGYLVPGDLVEVGGRAADKTRLIAYHAQSAGESGWKRLGPFATVQESSLEPDNREPVSDATINNLRVGLTETQSACLIHFENQDSKGVPDGFEFGSATLSSLRKLGLLEKFKGYYRKPGRDRGEQHVLWRITELGSRVVIGLAS